MNEHLRQWLDSEMKDFSNLFREFNRKLMKKVPLWMALSVIGMVALGFLVGNDPVGVLKVHFPIGCAIALFVWLCFWIQGRSVSMKKVRASYEKAIDSFFRSEDDITAFVRQMETQSYGKLDFMNMAADKYPGRFIAGTDYWVFFRDPNCRFIRVADIKRIYGTEEKTRVHYHMGDASVKQNLAVGFSLRIEYKENSASAKKGPEDSLFLENYGQYQQFIDLIRKNCPTSTEFLS